MTKFDWEKRTKPHGWFQIQRNQEKELHLQELHRCNKADKLAKERAQWETSSSTKANFIRETLENFDSKSSGGIFDVQSKDTMPTHANDKISAEDQIKKEEREKKEAKEGLKAQANERRAALLQHARNIMQNKLNRI